jgi:hypothetical protein
MKYENLDRVYEILQEVEDLVAEEEEEQQLICQLMPNVSMELLKAEVTGIPACSSLLRAIPAEIAVNATESFTYDDELVFEAVTNGSLEGKNECAVLVDAANAEILADILRGGLFKVTMVSKSDGKTNLDIVWPVLSDEDKAVVANIREERERQNDEQDDDEEDDDEDDDDEDDDDDDTDYESSAEDDVSASDAVLTRGRSKRVVRNATTTATTIDVCQ